MTSTAIQQQTIDHDAEFAQLIKEHNAFAASRVNEESEQTRRSSGLPFTAKCSARNPLTNTLRQLMQQIKRWQHTIVSSEHSNGTVCWYSLPE